MRKQIAYIVAFLLTVFSFPLSAQEKADGEGEKAFDPKETIFEHLLDGYGWELPFSHEHKIPLPVIVDISMVDLLRTHCMKPFILM